MTSELIRLECDYAEGAHPRLMEALMRTNMEQTPGYGEDEYCERARAVIRTACAAPDADVHFLVGGTQTNKLVVAAMLRPHQGVISADTGHINVHEAGAIESAGHKVLAIPSGDGRLEADDVEALCAAHYGDATREHMVQPGMVYISNPTENGTLYTKADLTALREVCDRYGMPLYCDGARMGYGLASPAGDLTLADYARLCDAFYIGGTKVGALFGEALVLRDPAHKKDFRYLVKQHGARFAKGRLLGVQFLTLFEDGLYYDISRHAVDLALRLRAAFEEKGVPLLYDSYTNQQFPILPDVWRAKLDERYACSFWRETDPGHAAVRYCTSWATRAEDVERLIADVRAL